MNHPTNPHDVLDARYRSLTSFPVTGLAWHESTAPERVHAAYAALTEALETERRLREEFYDLRTADERQEKERRDAHAAHLAGGPALKSYKRVDYVAQREDALLACQAAHQRARSAASTYNAMERDPAVMAEERAILVKALDGAHARAAEAVQEAHRAYAAFALARHRAQYLTGVLGDIETPPEGLRWADDDVANANEWGPLLQVAASTDPLVTGAWLVEALALALAEAEQR